MTELVDLSWRVVPAGLLMLAGAALALWSIRQAFVGPHLRLRDPMKALGILRCFRVALVGLCLMGIGSAWLWQIGWLLVLSLIIGAQELRESSVHIAALRSGANRVAGSRAVFYAGALPPTS